MTDDDFEYLTVDDILTIHEVIVESSEETPAGVATKGDIEYAVEYVAEGHFGQQPESVHETAFQLLRLLVANHPFVDGNKRTALASAVVFYGLNGYAFDYDHEMRAILKQLGTDEAEVDPSTVLQYLQKHTEPLPTEYSDTYELLLAVADASDPFGGQNGYDQPDER
jgi:death-on-curing protein